MEERKFITRTLKRKSILFKSFCCIKRYREFGDIIKESYEGYCERVELSDEEDIYTFDKYVEAISEIGEFEDPKILERKRNIGALLDCVPFVGFGKVLIEVISGENLITHEKLSFLERVIAGVSLIPIGAIAKWLKGVFKGGINSLLRRAGKSTITNIGEEVTEAVIKDEVRGLEKNIASEVTEDVVRETVEEIGEVEGREVVESVSNVKLTEPTLAKGGKPKGNYEKLRPGKDGQPIVRQNESADLLANKGYDIEMLPETKGGNGYGKKKTSNPDFLIDGEAFDCYSPDGSNIRNIWSTVEQKTIKQAERIVLNLDDYTGSIDDLYKQFKQWDIQDLKELLVIKDGNVTRWLP